MSQARYVNGKLLVVSRGRILVGPRFVKYLSFERCALRLSRVADGGQTGRGSAVGDPCRYAAAPERAQGGRYV